MQLSKAVNPLSDLPYELQDEISNWVKKLKYDDCLIDITCELNQDIPSCWLKEEQYTIYMKKYMEIIEVIKSFIERFNKSETFINSKIVDWIYIVHNNNHEWRSYNLNMRGTKLINIYHTIRRRRNLCFNFNNEDTLLNKRLYKSLEGFLIQLNYQELISLKKYLMSIPFLVLLEGNTGIY